MQDDLGEHMSERTCEGAGGIKWDYRVSKTSRLGHSRVSRSTHKMGRFDRKGALECGAEFESSITQLLDVLGNHEIRYLSRDTNVTECILLNRLQTLGQPWERPDSRGEECLFSNELQFGIRGHIETHQFCRSQ